MKRAILLLIFLFLFVSCASNNSNRIDQLENDLIELRKTRQLEEDIRRASGSGAKWSTYDPLGAGAIADGDDLMVRDISDTDPWATGQQKLWTWANMKADLANVSVIEVPNDTSTDAALTNQGEVHLRGDEDRVSFHYGASGEIVGEATRSGLYLASVSLNPVTHYAVDTQAFLFEVHQDVFPNGITIDELKVSCNVDPDVELDIDIGYSDAWIGLANPCGFSMDTTNGTFSQDTDTSIDMTGSGCSGDNTVPVDKVMYINFASDPAGTCIQMNFLMLFHAEED